MDSRWGRVARGWSTAIFATIVAGVSHTLAGGTAPTAFALVVSMILSATVCTVLAGRTLSMWRLAASVAVTQVLFHALFSGLGMPVAAAHQHAPSLLELTPTHGHAGSMWVAHIVAGLITLAALRYAEVAFWGLATTAALFIARLTARAVPAPIRVARVAVATAEPVAPHSRLFHLSSLRYRGPPSVASAL